MFRRAFTAVLASIVLVGVSLTPSYAAVNSSSGNGIKVSPVRTDLTINPGQTATVDLFVQNITNNQATFQAIIDDFTTTGESGTPALYLKNENTHNPHSLKQFISPIGNVSLASGQEKELKVTIKIPAGTPGGGYYGAVRFAPATANPSDKNLSLTASVATLILVKVPGPGLREAMNLSSFNVSQNGQSGGFFFSSSNLQVVARFNNQGNVQEEPFGKVVVTDMSGKVIMTKEINPGSPPGNVLPSSIRSFSVPLTGIGSLGKYKVTGNFGYGASGQLLSATTTFYVVAPWIIVLAVVILLLIILAILGMPKLFRAWYRRSISKSRTNK